MTSLGAHIGKKNFALVYYLFLSACYPGVKQVTDREKLCQCGAGREETSHGKWHVMLTLCQEHDFHMHLIWWKQLH